MKSERTETSAVLLVEDEPTLRGPLTEMLAATGYEATDVGSCEDARKAVEAGSYACAVFDLGLPDGDGLSLMAELQDAAPNMVPIVLTGDARPDTIIRTLRAGAFDFLVKPVDGTLFRAAVRKAVDYHRAVRDRDQYMSALQAERQSLEAKVQAATADIQHYAAQRELINARNHSLLRLTQISTDFYTDEALFRHVFEELERHVPVLCIVLRSQPEANFLCATRIENEDIQFITSTRPEELGSSPAYTLHQWVREYTPIEPETVAIEAYPQTLWNREICTVAFCLSPEFEVDEACDEFLRMCAHFVAFEWHEGRLFQYASREASLGNIALEMTKSFIQGLTAIRTAADFLSEQVVEGEAVEGINIICDNVETLRRQVRELRKLSTMVNDAIETVRLDEYVEQALEMLEGAIEDRDLKVEKELGTEQECVLLNGRALARTILDLASDAVRNVRPGGVLTLRLKEMGGDFVALEIVHEANELEYPPDMGSGGVQPSIARMDAKMLLSQRIVQSCGGRLDIDSEGESRRVFRIVLPSNAAKPVAFPEVTQ